MHTALRRRGRRWLLLLHPETVESRHPDPCPVQDIVPDIVPTLMAGNRDPLRRSPAPHRRRQSRLATTATPRSPPLCRHQVRASSGQRQRHRLNRGGDRTAVERALVVKVSVIPPRDPSMA